MAGGERMETDSAIVVPGDRIGSSSELQAGSGCYVAGDHLYASAVGVVEVSDVESDGAAATKRASVLRLKGRHTPVLPTTDSIVIAKVHSINARQAKVNILSVNDTPCHEPFPALIRVQDVRATYTDSVQIISSFRPGDFVRAAVINLGDSRAYLLTTARDDLGVIYAARDGVAMGIGDANTMVCPRTNATEARKVAMTA